MYAPRQQTFTLAEISALLDIPVHKLKEDIKSGKLAAEKRGWYIVKREDLIKYMKDIGLPFKIIHELR